MEIISKLANSNAGIIGKIIVGAGIMFAPIYPVLSQTAVYASEYINQCRKNLLDRLNPEIKGELEKYPFNLKEGYGGSWITNKPMDTIEWDNISDLEEITFYGVRIGKESLNGIESTIVHEYFHGIWGIYGTYASKETRRIDRDKFRSDIERFIHDPEYKESYIVKELVESWGLNKPDYNARLKRIKRDFPEEVDELGTIPQVLTERFAHFAEIYYTNPKDLPKYLRRHFKPFFK